MALVSILRVAVLQRKPVRESYRVYPANFIERRMKVAVITPYYAESQAYLRTCHDSVAAQTYPCTHFMVADGDPSTPVESWDVEHVRLPGNSADYGDTPRGVGSVLAIARGFDAITYLDADNWYYPQHIETLVGLHCRSGSDVISATRNLHRLDGSLMGVCTQCDGHNFVDTNAYFLTPKAFRVVPVWWMMPRHLHAIADRVMLAAIGRLNLSHLHCTDPTFAYRTAFEFHYRLYGETPPMGTKSGQEIADVLRLVGSNLKGLVDGMPL